MYVHHKSAISAEQDYRAVCDAECCADRRRQAIAHGSESSAGDDGTGVIELVVLGCPHLMLPDVGYDDRISFGLF